MVPKGEPGAGGIYRAQARGCYLNVHRHILRPHAEDPEFYGRVCWLLSTDYKTAPSNGRKWANCTRCSGPRSRRRHMYARQTSYVNSLTWRPRGRSVSASGGPIPQFHSIARRAHHAPRTAFALRRVASNRAAVTQPEGPFAAAAFARSSAQMRSTAARTAASSSCVGEPPRIRASGPSLTGECSRACAARGSRASSAASRAH
jgi:hypothetical protein